MKSLVFSGWCLVVVAAILGMNDAEGANHN